MNVAGAATFSNKYKSMFAERHNKKLLLLSIFYLAGMLSSVG